MFDKEKQSYTLAFAVGICIIAAGVLSFVGTQLQPLQEANAKFDKQKNILIALKIGRDGERYSTAHVKSFYADTADQATVQNLFEKYVQPVVIDLEKGEEIADRLPESIDPEDRGLAPAWLFVKDGKREAVAIDAIGKGLWSTLYGFLALEGDYTTVRGITFYQHGETAGLGDRIVEDWFQDNFVGKKIFDENDVLTPVSVAKSKAPEGSAHQVDGISGATLTCNGVTNLIAEELHRYFKWIDNQKKTLTLPAEQEESTSTEPAGEEDISEGGAA